MKKILCSLFAFFLLLSASSLCYADQIRENAAIIFIDNSKLKKNDVKKINYDPIKQILSTKFNILEDQGYNDRLSAKGLNDIALIERNDLLEMFKTDNFDYIVLIQIDSPTGNSTNTIITENFKIVDVKQARYIYNGRISRDTTWGSDYSVLKKLSKETISLIQINLINEH